MKHRFFSLCLGLALIGGHALSVEVIDEIYAIVNDEVITLHDLKTFEQASLSDIQARLTGETLAKAKDELKKNLMQMLINQKLVESKLKEKNYNVDADLEQMIKEIKKQNNFASDEDLKRALRTEGLDFDQWKDQMKEMLKIRQLKYDEIGSKVKVDNAQIMEYYKKNAAQFTIPEEYTLNAIYLKKESDGVPGKELLGKIVKDARADNIAEMAKIYSQLPDAATTPLLGKFKKGELAKELQAQVEKMKLGEVSSWVETDKGWYILQLFERKEAKMREYKEVRDEIAGMIREQIENEKFSDYIEQLKKESYVKILKPYVSN